MTAVAAILLTMAVSAAEVPGVASRLVTGPDSRVELTNTGRQAVTAWSFVVSTSKDGVVHREVHAADVYLAEVTRDLPRAQKHLDWLRPGETRAIPLDPVTEGSTVDVRALVFEDGTSAGDPQTVKSFFEHRAAERDALRQVVDIFNDVLGAGKGVAALEELHTRFGAPALDTNLTPVHAAREAVESYLQQARVESGAGRPVGTSGTMAGDQADQAIRTYAAFVQRQYALAMQHARPKN